MSETVLITGANRGIGLALAQEYAAGGAQVVAACRSPRKAAELQELAGARQGQIVIIELDATDDDSVRLAAQDVSRHFSETSQSRCAIDVLVNNAARGDVPDGTLEGLDMRATLDLLNVNTVGPLRVTKAFLPLMAGPHGEEPVLSKVVNISSGLGSISGVKSCESLAYGTSKAALNYLTRSLAFDLRRHGIIVAAVSPGWVRTDMGGKDAQLSPEESAAGIVRVIKRLTLADSSRWFNYDGAECAAW